MPRPRLPRLTLPWNRDRTPGDKRDQLVLVAEVAGFVVVIAIVATFVLMAATSGDDGVAAPRPAIPTITDAGGPESTESEPAPPPPPAETIAPPAAGKQEAVAPKPRPTSEPTTPGPTSTRPPDPDENGNGNGNGNGGGNGNGNGPPTARLWDTCSPEGAHAFTNVLHLRLECRAGQWRLA